jgi:hypothetical protein
MNDYIISEKTVNEVLNYLTKKPYLEVYGLIKELSLIKPLIKSENLEPKKEVKSENLEPKKETKNITDKNEVKIEKSESKENTKKS